SRENNSPTLESREEILSGYAIGHQKEGITYKCTASFWVRQQGLAYLTTVGHCAANGTLDPHGAVRFFFIEPGTENIKYFGNMTRYSIEPVDRGFILPSDGYSESPFIYSKELKGPLFAIVDFTRTRVSFTEGTVLCKSGSTTGYDCGKVTSVKVKTVLIIKDYGVSNYEDLTEVSTRCEYGDSGAPVFSFSNPLNYGTGVNMFGVVVGINSIKDLMYFMPLYQILDSDMNVITIRD
ncbi:4000_t:CDS:1, partial [Gigaspora rosea]